MGLKRNAIKDDFLAADESQRNICLHANARECCEHIRCNNHRISRHTLRRMLFLVWASGLFLLGIGYFVHCKLCTPGGPSCFNVANAAEKVLEKRATEGLDRNTRGGYASSKI